MGGGNSEDENAAEEAAAIKAVAKDVSTGWGEVAFQERKGRTSRPSKAAAELIQGMPAVRKAVSAGRPTLVAFTADIVKPAHAPRLPVQARAMQTLRSCLMEGDGRDYRCVAGAMFFSCLEVDVRQVDSEKDRVFCLENAPLLVFVTGKGKVYAVLKGAKECQPQKIYDVMMRLLEKEGVRRPRRVLDAVNGKLRELVRIQTEIEILKPALKQSGAPGEVAKRRLAAAEARRIDVVVDLRGILKDAGVPDAALPRDPRPEPKE